jgi:pantetheine-phosphate adenylyltransferase
MTTLAIYPGSFDPLTYGHLDVISRAVRIYSRVIVALAENSNKTSLFSFEERVLMLREATDGINGVEVDAFKGLVTDFAQKKGTNVLIRGLRMTSDFEYEFQMALTNRRMAESVETVFLMPSEKYSFLSSTLIKEIARLGGDLSSFVPPCVEKRLLERLQK